MKHTFLTIEQIFSIAPSVFSDTPDPRVSERYSMIKTGDLIPHMSVNGWGIVRAKEVKARDNKNQPFVRHELTFRHEDDMGFIDPRIKPINHGEYNLDSVRVYPEIIAGNSHNRSSGVYVMAGLFALLCANGLIISRGVFGEMAMPHINIDNKSVSEMLDTYTNGMPKVITRIQEWNQIILDEATKLDFANNAIKMRWGEDAIVDPAQLLCADRPEDKHDDLWTIFNVIQSKLIKGGIRNHRKTKGIKDIVLNNKINTALWDMAEKYA